MDSPAADGCVVLAHLGSGVSMCATKQRRSVATTMGFTALDGLPMARRCGNLDPGVVLYLLEQKGMSAANVGDLLYHSSALLGVSGVSDDAITAIRALAFQRLEIDNYLAEVVVAIDDLGGRVITLSVHARAGGSRR